MCDIIEDFYKCFTEDFKYDVLNNKTIGPLGGVSRSYTFNSGVGPVKLTCKRGITTLGLSIIEIKLLGTVKSLGERITSEGTTFISTSLTIDKDGKSEINQLLSTSKYNFPKPLPGRYIA